MWKIKLFPSSPIHYRYCICSHYSVIISWSKEKIAIEFLFIFNFCLLSIELCVLNWTILKHFSPSINVLFKFSMLSSALFFFSLVTISYLSIAYSITCAVVLKRNDEMKRTEIGVFRSSLKAHCTHENRIFFLFNFNEHKKEMLNFFVTIYN